MITQRLPDAPSPDPGLRIYAVGDVHGHADKLLTLHAAIRRDLRDSPVPRPLLIHLGDYIDRGPNSAGCLSLLSPTPPIHGVPTINLMGNHEWMLLAALERPTSQVPQQWLDNGGDLALQSWGIPPDTPAYLWEELIPPAHLAFLRDLSLSYVAGSYVFVHAGVRPGVRRADQRKRDLLWIRDDFLDWDGIMLPEAPQLIIVHGHTPTPDVVVRPNRIGADTGAGKGGPLTCAVLGAGPPRFLQI
ncbi:MAG: metallophosphoesterase family protein [Acetobacteraceae bacterium]